MGNGLAGVRGGGNDLKMSMKVKCIFKVRPGNFPIAIDIDIQSRPF